MNGEPWSTHVWIASRGREIRRDARFIGFHYHCRACARNFLMVPSSGEIFAIRIGAMRFDRLSDEVNARWLNEPCPGQVLSSNFSDQKKHPGQFSNFRRF